jgi:hypothetical protein
VEYEESLTPEQVSKIVRFKEEMNALLGEATYNRLQSENLFQTSDAEFIKQVALNMKNDPAG